MSSTRSNPLFLVMTVVASLLLLLLFAGHAQAAPNISRNGVLGCSGEYQTKVFPSGYTEERDSAYVLKNFNTGNAILITQIAIFSDAGAVLYNNVGPGGWPVGFNANLGANQSTMLKLTSTIPIGNTNVQTLIMWNVVGPNAAIPLHAWFRTTHHDDNGGATDSMTLTRYMNKCVSIRENY